MSADHVDCGLQVMSSEVSNLSRAVGLMQGDLFNQEVMVKHGIASMETGLATKLQEFQLPQEGLLTNLIAFNIGVELGQFAALALILLVINAWRKVPSFQRFSTLTNTALMSAGIMLMGYQLTGYFIN